MLFSDAKLKEAINTDTLNSIDLRCRKARGSCLLLDKDEFWLNWINYLTRAKSLLLLNFSALFEASSSFALRKLTRNIRLTASLRRE